MGESDPMQATGTAGRESDPPGAAARPAKGTAAKPRGRKAKAPKAAGSASGGRVRASGLERKLYKSGEVLKIAGVTRQMLYMYASMGIVEEAKKTPTGHKLYDESVFRRLKLIHDLHESGYTLRDIKDIFFK